MKTGCLGTNQSKSAILKGNQMRKEEKKMFVLSIHTFSICCISIYYKHMNKTVFILTDLTFWCRKIASVQVSKSRKYIY